MTTLEEGQKRSRKPFKSCLQGPEMRSEFIQRTKDVHIIAVPVNERSCPIDPSLSGFQSHHAELCEISFLEITSLLVGIHVFSLHTTLTTNTLRRIY